MRAVLARFGECAAVLADFVGAEVLDVCLAVIDELDCPVVELSEIVRGEVFAVGPIEAQPFHVLFNRLDELIFFLERVGVVEAQVAFAAERFRDIGRLALRASFDWPEFEFVQINDVAGDAKTLAHLLEFDSVQGRWQHDVSVANGNMLINNNVIKCTNEKDIDAVDWSGCDVVLESTGVHRDVVLLQKYLDQGVKRVVVSAPVKDDSVLNVVVGVNDHLFDKSIHQIVTAASCTTNCIAPVVKVIHEKIGIEQASFTTIHNLTNTQTILDAPHKDLRRARACGMSLIPTTTGSAKAVIDIFPELKGKIDGHAVRVPLANASLTDIIFTVKQDTSIEAVNALLEEASQGELAGILGFEKRPLVSIDYKGDQRSTIVDALSTMVVNKRMLKIYAWYDNEMGYATRTAELIKKVGQAY